MSIKKSSLGAMEPAQETFYMLQMAELKWLRDQTGELENSALLLCFVIFVSDLALVQFFIATSPFLHFGTGMIAFYHYILNYITYFLMLQELS